MASFADKVRSVAAPRRLGKSERRVERANGSTVIQTEHWDGRQDATVRPAVVRYGARVHGFGRRKGQTAEVREMSRKERRVRYGED